MLQGILEGTAFQAARVALGGLSRRQEAIGSNIANIDTPGYQRRSVEFEDDLAAALRRTDERVTLAQTDPRHIASASVGEPSNPNTVRPRDVVAGRNDGNDVSIDEEMTLLAETQLRYQALTTTVTRRLSTLRSVIRG